MIYSLHSKLAFLAQFCFAMLLMITPLLAADPSKDAKQPTVKHEPLQPKADVPVLVTAKLEAGAKNTVLKLQAVAPGQYIRKSDPAYEKEWTELPLRDDDTVSIRDVLVHMIEEYARHAGHADLLRECIDGRTGQ